MSKLREQCEGIVKSKMETPEESDEWSARRYKEDLRDRSSALYFTVKKMLDAKYIDASLGDFKVTDDNNKALAGVNSWLDNYKHGVWLVLKGTQGTGKTMLKNIIIKELYFRYKIHADSFTLYSLYLDYLDAIKNGGARSLLENLGKSKLLIIDELGRKESTTALKDFIFEVMDRLYLNGGSAILITNDTTVTDYIDESRLNEVGVALSLTGKDYRRK